MTATLNLDDLPQDYPGIGNALGQAGAICLESQHHTPGVLLSVRGGGITADDCQLHWTPSAARDSRMWQLNQATEWGAGAVAILLVKSATPYQDFDAATQGTGIDFWLGDGSDILFQRKARLEISGIRNGSDADIARRSAAKLRQTRQSDAAQIPAYVVVVEFGRPLAEVHQR